MVFELANVYFEQPVYIKKKIEQLMPYLIEISSMDSRIGRLPCLHYTKQKTYKIRRDQNKILRTGKSDLQALLE
jgi:hypothetical protein